MSIKGVDLTVSRYVGRVANGTSIDDLRNFVKDKQVDVVSMEQLATKQSYKLTIKRSDIKKIEDEDFWPSGIIIR